jgi:hypothetical protein
MRARGTDARPSTPQQKQKQKGRTSHVQAVNDDQRLFVSLPRFSSHSAIKMQHRDVGRGGVHSLSCELDTQFLCETGPSIALVEAFEFAMELSTNQSGCCLVLPYINKEDRSFMRLWR